MAPSTDSSLFGGIDLRGSRNPTESEQGVTSSRSTTWNYLNVNIHVKCKFEIGLFKYTFR